MAAIDLVAELLRLHPEWAAGCEGPWAAASGTVTPTRACPSPKPGTPSPDISSRLIASSKGFHAFSTAPVGIDLWGCEAPPLSAPQPPHPHPPPEPPAPQSAPDSPVNDDLDVDQEPQGGRATPSLVHDARAPPPNPDVAFRWEVIPNAAIAPSTSALPSAPTYSQPIAAAPSSGVPRFTPPSREVPFFTAPTYQYMLPSNPPRQPSAPPAPPPTTIISLSPSRGPELPYASFAMPYSPPPTSAGAFGQQSVAMPSVASPQQQQWPAWAPAPYTVAPNPYSPPSSAPNQYAPAPTYYAPASYTHHHPQHAYTQQQQQPWTPPRMPLYPPEPLPPPAGVHMPFAYQPPPPPPSTYYHPPVPTPLPYTPAQVSVGTSWTWA